MDKLRVGLIGIGGMGKVHFDAYKQINGAEVVSVCDVRSDVAKQKTSGTGVTIYTDAEKMMQEEKLDMIDICLPSYLHAEFAIKGLSKGLNVLSEKPMTTSIEDSKKVLAAAEKYGKKFMVAHVVRFMQAYTFLRNTIEEGKYGKLISLEMKRLSGVPTWTWNNWMLDEKLSGGVCVDLLIHDIDFVVSVLGKPDSTNSVFRPLKDNSSFIKSILYYGDTVVDCEGAWYKQNIPFIADYLAIFDKGYILYKNDVVLMNDEVVKMDDKKFHEAEGLNISGDNAYRNEIQYFVDCVRSGKNPNYVKADSSAYSVELALKLINTANKV